jgi:hypothetical protein
MRLDQIGIEADRHIKGPYPHNERDKIALAFVPTPERDWKPDNSDLLAAHKYIHPAYLA